MIEDDVASPGDNFLTVVVSLAPVAIVFADVVVPSVDSVVVFSSVTVTGSVVGVSVLSVPVGVVVVMIVVVAVAVCSLVVVYFGVVLTGTVVSSDEDVTSVVKVPSVTTRVVVLVDSSAFYHFGTEQAWSQLKQSPCITLTLKFNFPQRILQL